MLRNLHVEAKFEEDKQVLLQHYDIKYVSKKAINGQALVVLDAYSLLDASPLAIDLPNEEVMTITSYKRMGDIFRWCFQEPNRGKKRKLTR